MGRRRYGRVTEKRLAKFTKLGFKLEDIVGNDDNVVGARSSVRRGTARQARFEGTEVSHAPWMFARDVAGNAPARRVGSVNDRFGR